MSTCELAACKRKGCVEERRGQSKHHGGLKGGGSTYPLLHIHELISHVSPQSMLGHITPDNVETVRNLNNKFFREV